MAVYFHLGPMCPKWNNYSLKNTESYSLGFIRHVAWKSKDEVIWQGYQSTKTNSPTQQVIKWTKEMTILYLHWFICNLPKLNSVHVFYCLCSEGKRVATPPSLEPRGYRVPNLHPDCKRLLKSQAQWYGSQSAYSTIVTVLGVIWVLL